MRIGVVAIPGTFDSAFTSVLDILRVAEMLRPSVDRDIPPLETTVVGLRPSVRTAGGLIVEADRALDDGLDDYDVLVVPALGALSAPAVEDALALPEIRRLRAVLHDRPEAELPRLAGACTGTFLLAEAGRLDGVTAATSWWLSETFRRRYPKVDLDTSRMVVRSSSVLTAGAAFAHIDLAVSLVSETSPRLAETVVHHLLIDERPARSMEAVHAHLAVTDTLVTRLEDEVRRRISDDLSVTDLADALGVTRRTLERHVRLRTGATPNQLVRRLRAERAKHLRRTTDLSMDQIAHRVGYANAVTLRRLLASTT
ncbi:GlxA family transcriptional regulator [Conexibacter sp. W3-3-2]|uniref:GlxA family transcriptional regulator n=1 Tax=Conexibacter sp. W3-3-2 TaxID=2675227 RepID=UPI0018A88692|nr:helix-turn-helix domain-containing protein [Conexibacter sp. W3-3-2]